MTIDNFNSITAYHGKAHFCRHHNHPGWGFPPLNRSSNLPQRNAKGGLPGKFLTFALCRERPQPVDLSLYIEHNRLTHIGFPQEHFNILYSMWHVPTSELFVNSILFSHPWSHVLYLIFVYEHILWCNSFAHLVGANISIQEYLIRYSPNLIETDNK
jgi:hypothetical protein